ncbi:MAG TPA: peptidoglycan-binding protein [Pyrinomonadaceae bacterium]|nr:peptidoglycan-binding protein [Pyrinomonadaceae bacterium]
MARPILDDIELEQAQEIEVEEEHVLAQHSIPALATDFLQRLDRRALRVTLQGVLTGEGVRERLERLREKYRATQPVPFVSDVTTATKVEKVLIEELGVRELAGKPARFEYAFTLREFIPPPEPVVVPPPPVPPRPPVETGTLVVEVTVEGEPDFDFGTVTVTAEGRQDDGTQLSRELRNRAGNVWTEEVMPPGQYTATAVVTDPEEMSGSAAGGVRAAETTVLQITLRRGTGIAKAFIIHFRFDSAFLEPCMSEVLGRVFTYAQSHPNEKVVVVGHTDLTGSDNYNQALSERRARSVFACLTFGSNDALRASALADWNELRKKRVAPPNAPTINDTWATREYQYMLQELEYYSGNIDEKHGPKTDDAVRRFQSDNGLQQTGQVNEDTWPKLIEAYLGAVALAFPEDRFLRNAKGGCDGGTLKWLGCGEKDPVRNTEDAWRPNRRTEILFVRVAELPCEVPQPFTFDLPGPGAVAGSWCLGPGDPNQRCCFLTRQSEQPNKLLVRPAEPNKAVVSGVVTFDDGSPVANQKYALIAPDGEFLHTDANGKPDLGERPSGPQRGRPIPQRTDEAGRFSHPRQTPVGVYILELLELGEATGETTLVARASEEPPQEAIGNVVCFTLDG